MDDFLNLGANVFGYKFSIGRIRVGSIGKAHINDFLFGIGPAYGSGKSGVAKTLPGDAIATGGAGTAELRFVEAQSATHIFAAIVTGVEGFYGFGLKILHSAIISSVEEHLHHFGHIVGIAEQTGISTDSAKHGSSLVVDISQDGLIPEIVVLFRGHNLGFVEFHQRQIPQMIGTKRFIKVILGQHVHIGIIMIFEIFFKQVKPEPAVFIIIFGAQFAIGDNLINRILVITAHV